MKCKQRLASCLVNNVHVSKAILIRSVRNESISTSNGGDIVVVYATEYKYVCLMCATVRGIATQLLTSSKYRKQHCWATEDAI